MGAAMYMVFYNIGIVQLLSKDRFLCSADKIT